MIYGGLSGLDCALYSLLMVLFIKREIRSRSWIWMALFSLLLAGLVAKIICETTTGLTIFVANTHTNMVPVPLAHLVGGCIGFFISLAGVKSGKAPCRIWPPNLNYLSAFHSKTLIIER